MRNIIKYFVVLSGITICYNNCYSTENNNNCNYYNLTNKEYKIINKTCSDISSDGQDETDETDIQNAVDSEQKKLEDEFVQCLSDNQIIMCEIWNQIVNFFKTCNDIEMVCYIQKKNNRHYNISRISKYTEDIFDLYDKIINPIEFKRLVLNKKIPLSEENTNIANKVNNQNIVNIFRKYKEQYIKKCNKLLNNINESLNFIDKIIDAVNLKRVSIIKKSPVFVTDLLDLRKKLNNVKNLYYYSMCLNLYKDFINESIENISELNAKMYLSAI